MVYTLRMKPRTKSEICKALKGLICVNVIDDADLQHPRMPELALESDISIPQTPNPDPQ